MLIFFVLENIGTIISFHITKLHKTTITIKKLVWEALAWMASCRVDLTPTALPPPCQLHKTHDGDDDNDDDYDTNDNDVNNRNSTIMPTS